MSKIYWTEYRKWRWKPVPSNPTKVLGASSATVQTSPYCLQPCRLHTSILIFPQAPITTQFILYFLFPWFIWSRNVLSCWTATWCPADSFSSLALGKREQKFIIKFDTCLPVPMKGLIPRTILWQPIGLNQFLSLCLLIVHICSRTGSSVMP